MQPALVSVTPCAYAQIDLIHQVVIKLIEAPGLHLGIPAGSFIRF
jgi:hypothetical protein